MPRVPILEPRVGVTTPNVPAPVATPAPPEEAFGGGVQQATGNLGKSIANIGTVLSDHVVTMEKRESERIALENQTAMQAEYQQALNDPTTDENGVPKGFLNRSLSQANGATVQFDEIATKIAQKYAAMPVAPYLKNQTMAAIQSHANAARERVINHEADQRTKAATEALATYETSNVEAAGGVTNPAELAPLIKAAQLNTASMMQRQGHDAATIELKTKDLAGSMVKSSVMSILETNPARAAQVLDAMKGQMLPSDYVATKKLVDGKLDSETQLAIWNKVKDFKRSDGTIDSKAAQEFVYKLPITAEKKQTFSAFVNSMAAVADANLKEGIVANDRSYANALVQLHAKGGSFEEAIQLSTQFGRDMDDVSTKQNQAKELYTGKENAFDTWVKSMPQETQGAAEYAEQVFKATYPKKNNRVRVKGAPEKLQGAEAALQEYKLQALGKSPSQMRQLANEMVKDVVVKPGTFWDSEDIAWKVSAENRLSLAQAEAKLENEYGVDRVARAKSRLRKENIDINPFNLLKLLEKTKTGAN